MDLRMYASLSAARVEDGGEVPAAKLAIFILIAKSHFPPDIVMHTCSFFKLIYFNWRLTTLQYWGGFCHTLTGISHGCTCGPHPEPLCHLPPHPIPQGCPSAPALSAMSHASNLDWSSFSHMVIYMFQCYSFTPSHPCLLPHRPKVCSLHLCLFRCLWYRVMITIFLNSIYMR